MTRRKLKWIMWTTVVTIFLAGIPLAFAEPLPLAPDSPAHPGSLKYPYASFTLLSVAFEGRLGSLYLPAGARERAEKIPLLAFGHGYRSPEFTYATTFEHLARKGVAVAYVPYETSGKRDFAKMARAYNRFVAHVVNTYPDLFDASRIAFSGHSDGGSVATLASALQGDDWVKPAAILVFAISKNLPEEYALVPANVPCSLVVGEDDQDDPPSFSEGVLPNLGCSKQMITLRSYADGFSSEVIADHGSIRTFGWWGDQTSPLHYYGYWKFMYGAAVDAFESGKGQTPWLYGSEAAETGSPRLRNIIHRPQTAL